MCLNDQVQTSRSFRFEFIVGLELIWSLFFFQIPHLLEFSETLTHAGLAVLLCPSIVHNSFLYTSLFFFDGIVERTHVILHCYEVRLTCSTFCLIPIIMCQVQQVSHGLSGCYLIFSRNYFSGFTFYPVELQQVELEQGYETQAIVNDTQYHALIQQEQIDTVRFCLFVCFFVLLLWLSARSPEFC